jgi:hypothetical protein
MIVFKENRKGLWVPRVERRVVGIDSVCGCCLERVHAYGRRLLGILGFAVLLGLDEQLIATRWTVLRMISIFVFKSLNVPKANITNVDRKLYVVEHFDFKSSTAIRTSTSLFKHQTDTIMIGI